MLRWHKLVVTIVVVSILCLGDHFWRTIYVGGVRVAISRGVPHGEKRSNLVLRLFLSEVNLEIYV